MSLWSCLCAKSSLVSLLLSFYLSTSAALCWPSATAAEPGGSELGVLLSALQLQGGLGRREWAGECEIHVLCIIIFNYLIRKVVVPAVCVCLFHPSLIRLSTFPVSHREDSGDGETETSCCLHIQKLWDFNMSTWRRSMLVALPACKAFALSALKADGTSLRRIAVSSCKHPHTPSNYQNIMQQKSYRIPLMLCRKMEKQKLLKRITRVAL